ncbi:IPT/TIG domain-containing protein [Streptomyces sp. NPDC020742]|uniref:IPT/TIG domain-containing protein n=1 Tax=unclassified Streptomyces TaxID=2593676 RepID=UPI0033E4B199
MSTTPQPIALGQQAQLQPGVGPVLLATVPNSGPTTGGNTVTLVGLGLAGTTTVLFGGTPATIVGQDPVGLTVLVLAPAHAAGAVQVTATNAAGTSNPVTYVYVTPPPTVTVPVTPASAAVGAAFSIAGTNLTGATVLFGGTPATGVTVNVGGTALTGIVPPGTVGSTVTVTVQTPSGTANAGTFTYL